MLACWTVAFVATQLFAQSQSLGETPQGARLSCASVGTDVTFQDSYAAVSCPAGCQAISSVGTSGISIHPLSSAVCMSAIADGVLPTMGGEIVVTKVLQVPFRGAFDLRRMT